MMLTPRHVVAKIWSAAEVESQGPYRDQGVWGMAASWALSGGWQFPHPIFGQHVLWLPLLLFMMTHKRILTKCLYALEQGFVAQDIVPASGHIAEYGDITRRWRYLGREGLGKVSTDRWVGFWELGGAGGGDIPGCGLSTHAWELDVLGVSRPFRRIFCHPPVWYMNRGWFLTQAGILYCRLYQTQCRVMHFMS